MADERPIRPAGQATLWAFAGLDPLTGEYFEEGADETEEFLRTRVSMAVAVFRAYAFC